MKYQFPKNFWWGSATSGPQTESPQNRGKHVFDQFYQENPERFFEGKNVENNLENNFQDYVDTAKKLNFNSLRTSIQWTRLIPDGKNVSQEAVNFYRNYFQSLKKANIEPFANLMHFDLPMWLQEKGGWENKATIDEFVKYALIAFKSFGDLVKTWFTFNEPIVPVEAGYLYDWHYPNVVDVQRAMQVQFNSLMAHVKTVKAFKDNQLEGQIGVILNISPSIPRSQNPADLHAAKWAELFQSRCFLDPMINGVYPQELIDEAKKRNYIWKYSETELELIKNAPKLDLLGVNFYQPQRVKALDYLVDWKNGAITPHFYFADYEMPGRRMNIYRGWEIYPKSLYDALKNLQKNYQNVSCFVSENGMGVENESRFRNQQGQIEDTYRIEFLTEHLQWVHQAISEGANCLGYHMWTYVDNWSWTNAYKNRYGFVEFELETKKLKEKQSANWIRQVITKNGF